MKLAIFNGSPRNKKSNSTVLLSHFLNGYHDNTNSHTPIHYLANSKENSEHIQQFKEADTVILIFPLYTDAMPGQVKFFLESIASVDSKQKTVGFILQSGFPEAHHSIYLERYLDKFAKKMEWNYLGTVIKGGVEGIQIMPASMTKKLFSQFKELGRYFRNTGKFKPDIVKSLRTPYKMSPVRRTMFKFMLQIGVANFYWKNKLKEHKAYDIRSARPYAPA